MNSPEHNDSEIENALGQLKPRSLSRSLRKRLDQAEPRSTIASDTEAPTLEWIQLLIRIAIPGAAIAVVAAALLFQPTPIETVVNHRPASQPKNTATPEPDIVFTPIETNQIVLAAEELAILPGPDERPVQLMRVRVLDYERARAEDGTELLFATPREQVIPVTLTAY